MIGRIRPGAIVLGSLVALAAGLAAPCRSASAQVAPPPPPPAIDFNDTTWNLHYQWGTDKPGDTKITFKKGGAFCTEEGHCHGCWFAKDNQITFAFWGRGGVPSLSCVYSGTAVGDTFAGTQGWTHSGGSRTGTHKATRAKSP